MPQSYSSSDFRENFLENPTSALNIALFSKDVIQKYKEL